MFSIGEAMSKACIFSRIVLAGTVWAEVAALRGEMSALLAKQKQSAEAGSHFGVLCDL